MKLLIFIFISMASINSSAQSSDRWRNDNTIAGVQIAKVTNSTRSTVGVICSVDVDSCDAYLAIDVTCEQEVVTPMMINSKIGAFPVTTKCTKMGESQLLLITEFDRVIQAFQGGGDVGFAMPMESGQFKVVRFGSTGATAAIKSARQLPAKQSPRRLKSEENL